jgi:hypothetical protein
VCCLFVRLSAILLVCSLSCAALPYAGMFTVKRNLPAPPRNRQHDNVEWAVEQPLTAVDRQMVERFQVQIKLKYNEFFFNLRSNNSMSCFSTLPRVNKRECRTIDQNTLEHILCRRITEVCQYTITPESKRYHTYQHTQHLM